MIKYSGWFDVGPLGVGRTTALANACKQINATMLCANYNHAKEVSHNHGIKTVSIQAEGIGLRGPFLADHYAVQHIAHEYEIEIYKLQKAVIKLESQVSRQSALMDQYRSQRNKYKKSYSELLAKISCPECGSPDPEELHSTDCSMRGNYSEDG